MVLWPHFGCALVIFTALLPRLSVSPFPAGGRGRLRRLRAAPSRSRLPSATFSLASCCSASVVVLGADPDQPHWFRDRAGLHQDVAGLRLRHRPRPDFVAQSHIAIVMITITLATRGMFDLEQTVMVVFGPMPAAPA